MLSVKDRQAVERRIATEVILAGLAAGYTFEMDSGNDEIRESSEILRTACDTLAAMFATDEDTMYFRRDGRPAGWVQFIYGNSGYDVIHDWSGRLDYLIAPIVDNYLA